MFNQHKDSMLILLIDDRKIIFSLEQNFYLLHLPHSAITKRVYNFYHSTGVQEHSVEYEHLDGLKIKEEEELLL